MSDQKKKEVLGTDLKSHGRGQLGEKGKLCLGVQREGGGKPKNNPVCIGTFKRESMQRLFPKKKTWNVRRHVQYRMILRRRLKKQIGGQGVRFRSLDNKKHEQDWVRQV